MIDHEKNTSFRRLWTKTSVRRILEKYSCSTEEFICFASQEFRSLWNNPEHRKAILNLAGIKRDREMLFNCETMLKGRKRRIAFLKKEIMRLSKKQD